MRPSCSQRRAQSLLRPRCNAAHLLRAALRGGCGPPTRSKRPAKPPPQARATFGALLGPKPPRIAARARVGTPQTLRAPGVVALPDVWSEWGGRNHPAGRRAEGVQRRPHTLHTFCAPPCGVVAAPPLAPNVRQSHHPRRAQRLGRSNARARRDAWWFGAQQRPKRCARLGWWLCRTFGASGGAATTPQGGAQKVCSDGLTRCTPSARRPAGWLRPPHSLQTSGKATTPGARNVWGVPTRARAAMRGGLGPNNAPNVARAWGGGFAGRLERVGGPQPPRRAARRRCAALQRGLKSDCARRWEHDGLTRCTPSARRPAGWLRPPHSLQTSGKATTPGARNVWGVVGPQTTTHRGARARWNAPNVARHTAKYVERNLAVTSTFRVDAVTARVGDTEICQRGGG